MIVEMLNGYNSADKSFKVENYPWGFKLKCDIFYWIESKPKFGDRFCSYTIDPRPEKKQRKNKPKCSTYQTFAYMYKNEEGHVVYGCLSFNCFLEELRGKLQFLVETIGIDNINSVQQSNIKSEVVSNIAISSGYRLAKYTAERLPLFKQWAKDAIGHITKCEFKDITQFPEMPIPDFKD